MSANSHGLTGIVLLLLRRQRHTVVGRDLEVDAVQVHGVRDLTDVRQPHAHALALLHLDRRGVS